MKVKFKCDCGEIDSCRLHKLSKECKKCYYKKVGSNFRIHGLSRKRTPEYHSWSDMKQRCTNPSLKCFHNYGGRGITVCKRWQGQMGFIHFLEDLGPRPEGDYTLERINNNGNYEPDNCRWANRHDQLMNRRKGDGVYRIHEKTCAVCEIKFKGYFKNLYCSRSCQQDAYRKRKSQGLVKLKTISSSIKS